MNRFVALGTKLLKHTPGWTRDLAVTLGSTNLLRQRRRGVYREMFDNYTRWHAMPRAQMFEVQAQRLRALVDRAKSLSPYYRAKYAGVDTSELRNIPVLEKEDLQLKIDEIVIGDKHELTQMFTGGTTGRGIVVFNEISNVQERAALMDLFWGLHGFKIGRDRIAWFSGRTLLEHGDEKRNRFWRTNWLYKIRYYSTFHLSKENLPHYVADLNRFKPEFFNGFPSAINEVARFIEATNTRVDFRVKGIFVTSETLTDEQRATMERVFGGPVLNQYASSEGAPFIFECPKRKLHIDVTTGVFEVIDENDRPAREGEMLVTGFFTQETPVIRYRIGDRLRLAPDDARCECGWDTPLADAILGRLAEYIEVPGRGRIFNAQIGDCVKDVTSVLSFQVAVVGDRLEIDMVADRELFERSHKQMFLKKIHERVGDMPVDIRYVDAIPRAASGKQSLVRRSS